MIRKAVAILVFAAALFYLGSQAQPLGYGYLDPIGKITPQDECVYASSAMRMAEHGEWSTPYFLGRFFLYKPPLLYWLTAASLKTFGNAASSLRLPSLLAASAVCALVFLWFARYRRWLAGVCAAAILAMTPLFAQMANRTMTDAVLCLLLFGATYILTGDPQMRSWRTWTAVGAASGLAILLKSTAGVLPLMVLAAWWIVAKDRPSLAAIVRAGFIALLAGLPWYFWQYHLHSRWFYAEFIQVELLAYGAGAPPQQTAGESAIGFYAARLWQVAPVVLVAGLAGLFAIHHRIQRREPAPMLLLLSMIVVAAAVVGYQYRNLPYVLPLLPLLAVAAGYLPRPLVVIALIAAAVYAGRYQPPQTHEQLAIRRALERRSQLHRANAVLIVGLPEAFYASTLPLPKLHYALPAAEQPPEGFALDFQRLGITIPIETFLDLEAHQPRFTAELRAWGLPNDDAMATVVTYRDPSQIEALAERRPDLDIFYADGRVRWGAAR
ncbi:MAG: glycosyltransferase family 39 protein [Bryobacterales bacterium]|nr:glycosyltransferase family 39 protein [Bryobacterales bacterium]